MESYKTDARLREVIVNGRFQLQPSFVVLWETGRTWSFKDGLKTTTIDNKKKNANNAIEASKAAGRQKITSAGKLANFSVRICANCVVKGGK